ncbi:serine aminopeptidase domain-containing protein [Streptomyces sp. NPDC058257]|uniref:serine aminopeptidase domain-containing protein n=1 Tax=Streptomyces sp. NPDC058257 TaxID=3346409 RepID=UPI0036E502AE
MQQGLSQYFLTARAPADPVCVVRHHHDDAAPTVVLLTGLALSMSEPRYLWSILARRLRRRGLNVLQYDHPGHADSAATGRPATWAGARQAARAVAAHARKTGAGPVAVIGCGLGNVLAAELLSAGEAASGLLVCPDLALWRTGTDAAPGELAALGTRGRTVPDELQDSAVAAALLDAAVGEPYQPPQPAGPVDAGLLVAAAPAAQAAFAALPGTRTLIVAATAEDRAWARASGLPLREIVHRPDKWAPSWHWEHEPRETVMTASVEFLTGAAGSMRGGAAVRGGDGVTGSGPGGASVSGPDGIAGPVSDGAAASAPGGIDPAAAGAPARTGGPESAAPGGVRPAASALVDPGRAVGAGRTAYTGRAADSVPGQGSSVISSVGFSSDGEELLGILHTPDPGSGPWPVCLIYEPGNPGQRVDIHECGTLLAHEGAAHALPVFRYDSRGTGVSDGTFTHTTWSRRLADLRAAVGRLRAQGVAERFVVVGNSAGARLAAMAAHDLPEVDGAVLWGPILDEEAEDGPAPRLHRVDGTLAAAWCGLWLGVAYARDDRGRDYPALLRDSGVPVCVVYGTEELAHPDATTRRLLDETETRPAWQLRVVDGSHGFSASGLAAAVVATTAWTAAAFAHGAPAQPADEPTVLEVPTDDR